MFLSGSILWLNSEEPSFVLFFARRMNPTYV